MERITQKQLESLVEHLNKITKSPLKAYTKKDDGKFTANIGNYHLDYCYGRVQLYRMSNEHGGVCNTGSGLCTKRELYDWLNAFLRGIEAAQEIQ